MHYTLYTKYPVQQVQKRKEKKKKRPDGATTLYTIKRKNYAIKVENSDAFRASEMASGTLSGQDGGTGGLQTPQRLTLYRPECRAQNANPIKRVKLELVLEVVVGGGDGWVFKAEHAKGKL